MSSKSEKSKEMVEDVSIVVAVLVFVDVVVIPVSLGLPEKNPSRFNESISLIKDSTLCLLECILILSVLVCSNKRSAYPFFRLFVESSS